MGLNRRDSRTKPQSVAGKTIPGTLVKRRRMRLPLGRRILTAICSLLVLSSLVAYHFFRGETTLASNGAAQATIAIPAASGSGIKLVLPERFGINLDDSADYGPGQLTANFLASDLTNFSPQIWSQSSTCTSGTTTTWTDGDLHSPQPANFWQGAGFQVVSGADRGATGMITASTAANGIAGQVFTLSPALSVGCSNGDVLIERCRTALGTCAGGYSAANAGGLGAFAWGIGSSYAFETTDLSPSSTALQGLELIAPGNSTAGINPAWDATLPAAFGGGVWINLNGTYSLTFRAKATAGTPRLSYQVTRCCTAHTFLTGFVAPAVNATPGAGWKNYSFTFTAAETGSQNSMGKVILSATNGTVLLQDVALTETPTEGNTTAFRNAVYQKLLALQPGTLRFMTRPQWGCTFDNMIATLPSLCGNSSQQQYGSAISYNLNQFLTLAKAVGASPWWTFSPYTTPADMQNIAAYFGGICGNGNAYTAIRCNYGQTTPWTEVFSQIYLEFGNEVWNSPNGVGLFTNSGYTYGLLVGANNAALKSSPYYSSKLHMVASGFIQSDTGSSSWNGQVLSAAKTVTNGLPDYIGGAPYVFDNMTDLSVPNLWTSMFAEPVNINSTTSGITYQLQHYAQKAFGVDGAIYETNLGTNVGIEGVTQSQIDGIVAGVGAGLDASLNMLLAARDAGIKVQTVFALPEIGNAFTTCASPTAGICQSSAALHTPLWGTNRYMPGPGSSGVIDRPSGIALQMINTAIGSKLDLLNTVQTGTPTYNQPAAQPNPQNGGLNSIAANKVVPLVQAFGFGDGAGNYTLIVYNLDLNRTRAITFSGAGAPTGPCTRTVFTSANITDNNEGVLLGSAPVVKQPASASYAGCASGDTLPPFSMVTYTYTSRKTP